jgi:modulator of FtsH protease HflK
MPWNNEDGGNKGPWGQGPNGPGNRGPGRKPTNLPPEIDDILKRGADNFKGFIPGRGGWLLPVALLAAFWAYNSLYQVQPDQKGIVLRFGEFSRTANPGLHFALWPMEKMELLPVAAEKSTSIGEGGDEGLMLTGDENIIDIRFKVLWKIADPKQYLFNIQDPEKVVQGVAESAMREVVGRTQADEVLTTGRLSIQDQVLSIVQNTLNSYTAGIQVVAVNLESVDPPQQVINAFEEVQRAKQEQVDFINQADQYTNKTLREAEGEIGKIIEEAKGYKAQAIAGAQGEAQRFEQVLQQYELAKDVTRKRMFIETMENVLTNSNKVIIETAPGGQGVVPYLPLPQIQTKPAEGTVQ